MNEKEKMLAGELYDANYNEELIKERYLVKDKCYTYNQLKPSNDKNWQVHIEKRLYLRKPKSSSDDFCLRPQNR